MLESREIAEKSDAIKLRQNVVSVQIGQKVVEETGNGAKLESVGGFGGDSNDALEHAITIRRRGVLNAFQLDTRLA